MPQEATIPFNDMAEDLVDGIGPARFFHTVIDGSPVLVKTREGRPILVAPSPNDVSGRGLSVRHHAALMDVYDPDRARGPLSVRRGKGPTVASSWAAIGPDVVAKLKAAGAKAVLLTGPVGSPALAAAIAALAAQTGVRHVVWSPLENDAAGIAWKQAFGDARVARPRLDKADLLVGLGAEFLDRPEDGFERDFAVRRAPDQPDAGRMSRFVQLEGRLTLTGANADRRIRVRDSQLAPVAAALAHELIVVRKVGPLAGDAAVGKALAPFAIDTVATQAGLDAAVLKALAGELAAAPGKALVVAGGSASASASGPAIELAAILLNVTLGAFDAGLFDDSAASERPSGGGVALAALAEEMRAGKVEMLVVAGVNPVYDAPASVKIVEALAKVPFDRLAERSARRDDPARRRPRAGQPPVRVLGRCRAAEGLLRGPAAGHPAALRYARSARRRRRLGRRRGRPGRVGGRGDGDGQDATAPPCDGRPGAESERGLPLPARRVGDAVGCRTRDAGVRDRLERGPAVRPVAGARAGRRAARVRPDRARAPARPGGSAGGARAPALSAPRARRRARRQQRLAPRAARSRSPGLPGAARCRSRRADSTR